jgi:hypothetical protein
VDYKLILSRFKLAFAKEFPANQFKLAADSVEVSLNRDEVTKTFQRPLGFQIVAWMAARHLIPAGICPSESQRDDMVHRALIRLWASMRPAPTAPRPGLQRPSAVKAVVRTVLPVPDNQDAQGLVAGRVCHG